MTANQRGLELAVQVGFKSSTFPSRREEEAKGKEVSQDPPTWAGR